MKLKSKIVSVIISAALFVPMVPFTYAADEERGVDISSIPGVTVFNEDFDSIEISEGMLLSEAVQGAAISDAFSDSRRSVSFVIEKDEISEGYETSNRVLKMHENVVSKCLTDAEWSKITTDGQYSGVWYDDGTGNRKYLLYVDNTDPDQSYFIGIAAGSGTTPDRNAKAVWFARDTNGIIASKTNTRNYWFCYNSEGKLRPYVYNETGKDLADAPFSSEANLSTVTFPMPEESKRSGEYAFQFRFAYPENGNIYGPDDSFAIVFDGKTYNLNQNTGIKQYNTPQPLLITGEGETSNNISTTSKKIPINSAVPTYLSSEEAASQLQDFASHQDKEWHKLMVRANLTDGYYSLYYDGMPIYFQAENGKYSCQISITNTSELPQLSIQAPRMNTFDRHTPVFDNFVMKHNPSETDMETAQLVLDSIELPYVKSLVLSNDIVFDQNESQLISWSFSSDVFTIDTENPRIARLHAPEGFGTTDVTLTATCTINDVAATREFPLKVKNLPLCNIENIKLVDSSGQRVYFPKEGTRIGTIDFSKNHGYSAPGDGPVLIGAVYNQDGALLKAGIRNVKNNGTYSIAGNLQIGENETYKIFVWDGTKLEPLAECATPLYVTQDTPKIFVLGDSIAQTYDTAKTDLRGWGQRLSLFFDGIEVDNSQAVGVASTSSALAEGHLSYVLENGEPGDYVFIMLGHNDEKTNEYYGTTPEIYSILLSQMVEAVKGEKMIPVLLTPLARPVFDEDVPRDTHSEYSAAMKTVADKYSVPLIDVDSISRTTMETSGMDIIQQYYSDGDTHTVEAGADWVCSMITEKIKSLNLPIASYLKSGE